MLIGNEGEELRRKVSNEIFEVLKKDVPGIRDAVNRAKA